MRRPLLALVLVTSLVAGACADEGDEPATAPDPADEAAGDGDATTTTAGGASDVYADHDSEQYAGTASWICHPELPDDVCDDGATTVIDPDGTRRVEEPDPADEPGFDCFYVYPTTSADPGPASDLDVDESELDTVQAQVARYSSVCRVFAPAYRQVTMSGLGAATEEDWARAYGDVVDAWRSYVVDQNEGRGVALVGHSQGAGHLRRLIEDELDAEEELRDLVVSAVLLGGGVPTDGMEHLPPCTSAQESGCVVSYAAFPADEPPVEGALFGRVRTTGEPALCVNPVELLGVEDEPVEAVVPVKPSLVGGVGGYEDVETPFVTLPEAVRLACAATDAFGYLAVDVTGAAEDDRQLDVLGEQRLGPTWGLHLLDAQYGQDRLIDLVARQAEAHAGS
jgi:pimeloyl-ACP methyl ester carboxylesterase